MPRLAVNVNHETKECSVELNGDYMDLVAMLPIIINNISEEADIDPLMIVYYLNRIYVGEE